MTNGFDGTEALTYRHEPHAGVVNRSAIPYECLFDERNMQRYVDKVMSGISPDDPEYDYVRYRAAQDYAQGFYPPLDEHLAGYEVSHDADFAG